MCYQSIIIPSAERQPISFDFFIIIILALMKVGFTHSSSLMSYPVLWGGS